MEQLPVCLPAADVLFWQDINSCTLPKPTLLSLGADVAREQAASGGVIFMNVSAYSTLFPSLLKYAEQHEFGTESVALDQSLLLGYLEGTQSLLPDIFNYKPYWGMPEDIINCPSGRPVIVHMQGPKPSQAVCALEEYRRQQPSRDQLMKRIWPGRDDTLKACRLDHPHHVYTAWDVDYAYETDRGEMYFTIVHEFLMYKRLLEDHATDIRY